MLLCPILVVGTSEASIYTVTSAATLPLLEENKIPHTRT